MSLETQVQRKFQAEDTALSCFAIAASYLGVNVDKDSLNKEYSNQIADMQLLRQLAQTFKFKAQIMTTKVDNLPNIPIPAIARMTDGHFVVMGWNDGKNVFISDPTLDRPVAVPVAEFAVNWTGELVVFTQKFDWHRTVKKYNLDWFYSVILHYKRYFAEVFAASFFLQVFGLVVPLFTQVIIDKVLGSEGISTLDILAGTLLALSIFQCGLSILRTYLLTHTTNKLDVILGSRLFRHLSALPMPYFEHRRVGDTMMRVGALASIREFLTGTAITVVLDVLFSVVFIAVMFYFSTPLTWLSLAIVPVYILLNVVATPIFRKRLEAVWAAGAENNAFLVEAVTGMQTVKSLALEPQFVHRWEQLLARYVSKTFDSAKLNITITSSAGVLQLISSMSILWMGGHMVMEGGLTLGQLIAFQMLAGQANAPILTLIGMWQNFQQAVLSMERMSDILNTRSEPVLAKVRSDAQPIQGAVAFEKVSFRYRLDMPEVLKDISFQVPPGTRVGIVGRSGSGKSTLTKLIQRMYIPEQGRVLIDGNDLTEVPPAWLRSQIGVVLQENYLFNSSVRDNIALTRPSASMNEVINAAKVAGAHEFILELPEGYDTKVGERGTSLSGGQRQRVAIARALLTNPRIMIFDEATSALDYESERIIMNNLDQISAGRTLFMIAHRLSTVQNCNVIAVIDRGCLVEAGTHDQLIAAQGLYHHLYLQQEG
jgi:subfamily B ATP-binding cassette protein HlyB/CyaB